MPSIVTHYLFAEEVLEYTTKEIKTSLSTSIETYYIFSQSFDNLFYYNLLTPKKGKKVRQFGNFAQRTKTNEYFKNIILEIQNQKLQNNGEILAYLYGSLTHYILDSTCHPFIIYQAGWIDEKNKNYQYRGNHEKIEVNIDTVMYQEKRNASLYQANLGTTLLPSITFSNQLKNVINNVMKKTFQQENMGKIYEKSTKQGHNILNYFVTDHYGLKKFCYQIFDTIFFKNKTKYQNLSFHIKSPDVSYLNRKHELWSNPVDNQRTSTESFDDLYHKALKDALYIFQLTNKLLENKININDYLRELGNKSYTTGLDCAIPEDYKYFKN